jgi:transcriptional regulator GlxA family with amidase domain
LYRSPDDEGIAADCLSLYEANMSYYENAIATIAEGIPVTVELLVMPNSSLMTLASAGDPLRAANRVTGRKIFDWRYVSLDSENPITSSGTPWHVAGKFDPSKRNDIFVVIAGFRASAIKDRKTLASIFRAAKGSRLTIGVESGAWLLARAGLLEGKAATTHWEDFEEFSGAFPDVELRPDRYVIDGRYITTSGASPTFDMMIDLIRQRAGLAVAHDVAGVFIHESSRSAGDYQSHAFLGHSADHDPRIVKAISIMERCVDAPVTIAAIARRAGISVRGLEQLFVREIGQTPGAYFLSLRLNAARRYVLDTGLPITDIASRTGFSSINALSRAFRNVFGESPAKYRKSFS